MDREQRRKRGSGIEEPGTCDPGFVFYSCQGGFVGCCAVEACSPGGCPEDALPSNAEGGEDVTSTASPADGGIKTQTQTQTVTLDITSTSTITSGSSPESSATTTTTSDSATGAITPPPLPPLLPPSSSPTSPSSLSLSLSLSLSSPSPTVQTDTTSSPPPPPPPTLSTAAIAGICISSTVFALAALLVAGLLIRRRRIAKRVAAETLPNSPYADEPERFMMDHPAWRGQGGGAGVFRGVSELP
ncbi:hypothetical protein F4813DRAFT_396653 [Daldinia decipiens]|uniref:uncharacterized protein n=1 Tax=Daldinia decipiens TaxID=326647 RepID=UPI0020C4A2BD|nr:uncharacterized protein F4813DRAFT_396653 [Daldinia decipiens]KAI1657140.1 hypothetical protein F4813DRAFT_396653 [Daldinia decipiens]